jgi:cytochrome b6-f complex iron-sulfur subunit
MQNSSRRDFLKLATTGLLSAAGLIGLAGLMRFLDYESEPAPQTVFELGSPSKYPAGSRTVLLEVPAILFSTQTGFQALSLVCTHLGCTVEPAAEGFACPCHGSRYNPEGKVLRGPALKPLRALRTEITSDGRLLLHTD